MSKIQCLLAFTALFVGLARSWEIAVTAKDKIQLYGNNIRTFSYNVPGTLTALTYDAANDMLFFADTNNDNTYSIFSFDLANNKQKALIRRNENENIHGLAYDPVKGLLFWTDINEKSIYWISYPSPKEEVDGNILLKFTTETPRGIAVDSCRGYIYWTNIDINKPTIERARLNGSNREIIVDNKIHMPLSIALDQQTKKIYWTDDEPGIAYSIQSADLDGNNRKTLFHGSENMPSALAISADSIYWLDSDNKAIWKIPKIPQENTAVTPTKCVEFSNEEPFSLTANYLIEEQSSGPACEALANLTKKYDNNKSDIPKEIDPLSANDKKAHLDVDVQKCPPGYFGKRCDASVCYNYCLQGECTLTKEKQPICRCTDGYSGIRCEINICHNHCLNNGRCSVNENKEPTCQCKDEYEGTRCETHKVTTTDRSMPAEPFPVTQNNSVLRKLTNTSNDVPKENISRSQPPEETFDGIFTSCSEDWDPVRDPVIMALGILIGVLGLACAVLVTKVLQLKKRPRIKKRFIGNRNGTPMTARPDQCEITIENCCNMNICETPCFEPRSTIRHPTLINTKLGKEEKKNLIANMEYPEDPY